MEPFFDLPEDVKNDVEFYRLELERFRSGEVPPDRFKPFRVSRGIYSQRGQKKYMMRIKVPGGGITPEQMVKIAELSLRYGNGKPHVTTRQAFQLHDVDLDDTPRIMEELIEVGLTGKGGGGNTVRNITACPDAGVCSREVFDVSPFAPALTEYFLAHPRAFNLPRKFKIAFSGCPDDCALATVTDVGFVATRKVAAGEEKRGFRLYAAGGMGANSRVGELIEDFVPEEDAAAAAEALLLLFDRHGDRKNKHRARLRFVIERLGREEFVRLYREEFRKVKEGGPKGITLRKRLPREERLTSEAAEIPVVSDAAFNLWRLTNVRPQKQEGYYFAKIRLPLGDIEAATLKKLAEIIGDFGEGTVRTTQDQNMMVRWLKGSEVYSFYEAMSGLGLALPGAGGPADIASCPGASTCNLGICLSRNLSTALTGELEGAGLPLHTMPDVRIKVSGCPNSCGQHPVGPIGLFGAARRGDGRMAPHYNILLGGRVGEGVAALGEEFGFVPAKKVPALIKRFLNDFSCNRRDDEDFYAWLEREGKEMMREMIQDYPLPLYEEERDCYRDWGVDEEFSLSGLGPGECGVGALNMIEADIEDGKRYIYKAGKDLSVGRLEDASEALSRALALTAKALLVSRGVEPVDDYVSVVEFERHFVEKGLIPERFGNLKRRWARYLSGLLDREGVKKEIAFLEELSAAVSELYGTMGADMKFEAEKVSGGEEEKPERDVEPPAGAPGPEGEADAFMDLRGVKCPINYVKAKLKLETMAPGETLRLFLDDGEPIRNVPNSLRNDGHEIVKTERSGDHFDLIVKKG